MIRVITVEREYGSRGGEFAHRLAEHLGWKLFDECVALEVAQQAGVAVEAAERCDERVDPWFYRFSKAFWHGSVDRMPAPPRDRNIFDSERMREMVQTRFEEVARIGQAVIVGRGAANILARTPGVFHVFVYASQWRKEQWFAEQFSERSNEAAPTLAAIDRRRADYIRRYHDRDWDDRRLYHMMINSCMGFEAMVQAVTDGAGVTMPAMATR